MVITEINAESKFQFLLKPFYVKIAIHISSIFEFKSWDCISDFKVAGAMKILKNSFVLNSCGLYCITRF